MQHVIHSKDPSEHKNTLPVPREENCIHDIVTVIERHHEIISLVRFTLKTFDQNLFYQYIICLCINQDTITAYKRCET